MTDIKATLNLDHDDARALHRIMRAMHDGECPCCHTVCNATDMRVKAEFSGNRDGWTCPYCCFAITRKEAEDVTAIFAPFMERNLAIFEKWRADRNAE